MSSSINRVALPTVAAIGRPAYPHSYSICRTPSSALIPHSGDPHTAPATHRDNVDALKRRELGEEVSMRTFRRLLVSIGSLVGLFLAGGALYKIGG